MKNIHVLSTPNPSRLIIYSTLLNELRLLDEPIEDWNHKRHIYITNDEDIKEGAWYISILENEVYKATKETQNIISVANLVGSTSYKKTHFKIILTTDTQLIQDGIQAIDDEFLEWFVKNPSCEEVETVFNNRGISGVEKILKTFGEYKIIIPKEELKQFVECKCTNAIQAENCIRNCGHGEEHKQETFNSNRGLKEVQLKDPNTCENYKEVGCIKDVCDCYTLVAKKETLEEVAKSKDRNINWLNGANFGAKWQQERSYSEEEVEPLLSFICDIKDNWDCDSDAHKYGTICRCCDAEKTLEQFKKK